MNSHAPVPTPVLPIEGSSPTALTSQTDQTVEHIQLTPVMPSPEGIIRATDEPGDGEEVAGIKRVSLKIPSGLFKLINEDIACKVTQATNPHAYILETLTLARVSRQSMADREKLLLRVEELRNLLSTETDLTERLRTELDQAVQHVDERINEGLAQRLSMAGVLLADGTDLLQQIVDLRAELAEARQTEAATVDLIHDERLELTHLRARVTVLVDELEEESTRADDATDVLTLQRAENAQLKSQLSALPTVPSPAAIINQRDAVWMEIINDVCEAAAIPGVRPALLKAQLLKVGEDSYNKKFAQ